MSKINQLVQQTNADANSDLSDLLDQKVDRRALYKEIVSNKALDSLPVATKKLLRNGTQKTLKAMIHNATLLQNMKSLTWSEAKQNLAQNQDAQSGYALIFLYAYSNALLGDNPTFADDHLSFDKAKSWLSDQSFLQLIGSATTPTQPTGGGTTGQGGGSNGGGNPDTDTGGTGDPEPFDDPNDGGSGQTDGNTGGGNGGTSQPSNPNGGVDVITVGEVVDAAYLANITKTQQQWDVFLNDVRNYTFEDGFTFDHASGPHIYVSKPDGTNILAATIGQQTNSQGGLFISSLVDSNANQATGFSMQDNGCTFQIVKTAQGGISFRVKKGIRRSPQGPEGETDVHIFKEVTKQELKSIKKTYAEWYNFFGDVNNYQFEDGYTFDHSEDTHIYVKTPSGKVIMVANCCLNRYNSIDSKYITGLWDNNGLERNSFSIDDNGCFFQLTKNSQGKLRIKIKKGTHVSRELGSKDLEVKKSVKLAGGLKYMEVRDGQMEGTWGLEIPKDAKATLISMDAKYMKDGVLDMGVVKREYEKNNPGKQVILQVAGGMTSNKTIGGVVSKTPNKGTRVNGIETGQGDNSGRGSALAINSQGQIERVSSSSNYQNGFKTMAIIQKGKIPNFSYDDQNLRGRRVFVQTKSGKSIIIDQKKEMHMMDLAKTLESKKRGGEEIETAMIIDSNDPKLELIQATGEKNIPRTILGNSSFGVNPSGFTNILVFTKDKVNNANNNSGVSSTSVTNSVGSTVTDVDEAPESFGNIPSLTNVTGLNITKENGVFKIHPDNIRAQFDLLYDQQENVYKYVVSGDQYFTFSKQGDAFTLESFCDATSCRPITGTKSYQQMMTLVDSSTKSTSATSNVVDQTNNINNLNELVEVKEGKGITKINAANAIPDWSEYLKDPNKTTIAIISTHWCLPCTALKRSIKQGKWPKNVQFLFIDISNDNGKEFGMDELRDANGKYHKTWQKWMNEYSANARPHVMSWKGDQFTGYFAGSKVKMVDEGLDNTLQKDLAGKGNLPRISKIIETNTAKTNQQVKMELQNLNQKLAGKNSLVRLNQYGEKTYIHPEGWHAAITLDELQTIKQPADKRENWFADPDTYILEDGIELARSGGKVRVTKGSGNAYGPSLKGVGVSANFLLGDGLMKSLKQGKTRINDGDIVAEVVYDRKGYLKIKIHKDPMVTSDYDNEFR